MSDRKDDVVAIQVTLRGPALAAVKAATGSRRPLSHGVQLLIEMAISKNSDDAEIAARERQVSECLALLASLLNTLSSEISELKAERQAWLKAAEAVAVRFIGERR